MRRFCTIKRSLGRAALRIAAAGSVSAAAITVAAIGGPSSAGAAPTLPACSGVVAITHLAFKPSVVSPGQTSVVHLSAQNCTNQTQTTTITWLGRFKAASGGIAAGCPVIDPFSQGATFVPGGSVRAQVSYLVPASCTATALAVTARVSQGAMVLAEKTARLTIAQPALLVGELGIEGGPYPGGFHPTAGTVEVEFSFLPLILEKAVGSSGQFKIPVGPGTYTVIGCGPTASGTPSSQCSAPQTITLSPGEVGYIQLIWAYAP